MSPPLADVLASRVPAGIALSDAPAGHGLRPIRVWPGDLRDGCDRARWPVSWRCADPLAARALYALDGRPRGRRLERHAEQAATHGWRAFSSAPPAPTSHKHEFSLRYW
jgi:hypothetical protein